MKPRGLEVPEGFGGAWAGREGGQGQGQGQGNVREEGRKVGDGNTGAGEGGGTYDPSRDPRIRR